MRPLTRTHYSRGPERGQELRRGPGRRAGILPASPDPDVHPNGFGPLNTRGDLKLDGMTVDHDRYGDAGHPYRVELWANGAVVRAVGDTGQGQPEFRVRANADNPTPWGCPAP